MMWAGFMSGPSPKAARSEATSTSGSPAGTTGTPSTGVLSIWEVALVSESAMLKAKTSTSERPASVALAVSRLPAGLGSPSVTKIRIRRLPPALLKKAPAWLTAAPKSVPPLTVVGSASTQSLSSP